MLRKRVVVFTSLREQMQATSAGNSNVFTRKFNQSLNFFHQIMFNSWRGQLSELNGR